MTKIVQNNQQNQQSFLNNSCAQDKQIPVDQLSGDEGVDKTVMVTFRQESKANLFQTIVTIIKTTIGSAVISLPYTVSVMGWVLSLIMFIFFAFATQYTTYILLKIKNLSKHSTYNSIFYHIYKLKFWQFCLSFLNLFCNIGFSVAMLTILKGAGRKVILDYFGDDKQVSQAFYSSEWFITIVVSVGLIPTIIVRRVQSLRYISIIGVFALVIAIAFMFFIFFDEMFDRNWQNSFTMNAFPTNIIDMISVFPNIMFALIYQMNFFSILKGLKNATDSKMNTAAGYGMAFCIIIYILIGIMGYCLFGDDKEYVKANFLLQLNKNELNPLFYVGIYLGFLVCDLFCIPTTFFVARNNMIVIIKMLNTFKSKNKKPFTTQIFMSSNSLQQLGSYTQKDNLTKQQAKKEAKIKFYVYTLILYILFVAITIFIKSLQAVFNIVGSIASCTLSFLLPFSFYVLLIKKKNKPKTINYIVCWIGIIVTIPLGIVSIISLYI